LTWSLDTCERDLSKVIPSLRRGFQKYLKESPELLELERIRTLLVNIGYEENSQDIDKLKKFFEVCSQKMSKKLDGDFFKDQYEKSKDLYAQNKSNTDRIEKYNRCRNLLLLINFKLLP
tara:strand:- start:32 stop:388 length:357 start_codon:yes stop_codon:yes gene_type:complete